MRTRESVEAVIKAYDVRGIVGEGFDAEFMQETGCLWATHAGRGRQRCGDWP